MDVVALTPGRDFRRAVADFLRTCDIFLAVIGPAWERGDRKRGGEDHVMTEIETALAASVYVIPVLVGGAGMPSRLPAAVEELANRHAVELSDLRWAYDMERLLHVVRSLEPRPDPEPAPDFGGTTPPPPTPPGPALPPSSPRAGSSPAAAEALAGVTGDCFTLVLPTGADRRSDLHDALLGWFRSRGLETTAWDAQDKAWVVGRGAGSAWSRWSGLDTGLFASFTQDAGGLQVRVFATAPAGKLTRAGIALVFLVFFPLMALPVYGGYRQAVLLRECRAFLERTAAAPPHAAAPSQPRRVGGEADVDRPTAR